MNARLGVPEATTRIRKLGLRESGAIGLRGRLSEPPTVTT